MAKECGASCSSLDAQFVGERKPLLDKAGDPVLSAQHAEEGLADVPKDGPPARPPHSFSRKVVGYTCTLLAVVGAVTGAACAQALGGLVPKFELNLWRYLAQFIVTGPVAIYKWRKVIPEKRHMLWLLVVSLASVFYNLLFYTAATHLSLGTLGGVTPSLTLIFIALWTAIFMRNCSVPVCVAVVLCIGGILCITQPHFMFKDTFGKPDNGSHYHPICRKASDFSFVVNATDGQNATSQPSQDDSVPTDDKKGYIMLFFAGLFASIARFATNRKLHDLDSVVAAFWVGTTGVVLSAVPMMIHEYPHETAFPSALNCQLLIVGHAAGAGCGAMFSLIGAQTVVPVVFGMLQTLQVVLLFISQFTFMHNINPGKGNFVEIIGAVVVVIGNTIKPIVTFVQQRRRANRDQH